MLTTAQAAVLVVAGLAAGIDVATRRVPNVLTFGSAAAALVYHAATAGSAGALQSGSGWIVGVALFAPLFIVGGLGAGDVKLLGAVGAWLGPQGVLESAWLSVLAGGVLALAVALRRRYLRTAAANLVAIFACWRATGLRRVPGLTIEDSSGPRLAYATAIAAGTWAAVWRA
ncbi:MAG: prepilin peptidase [Acidobacteria bacterium]|nr:prepilin peptidase [Acidobacteriota bacterium]